MLAIILFFKFSLAYFPSVGDQRELCEEIVKVGQKIQDLSQRVAKLDNGKVYNMKNEEFEILKDCGIVEISQEKCPNIDLLTEYAEKQGVMLTDLGM